MLDKHKTKVKFLINVDELFAYFPELEYNDNPKLKTCYSHIGQHSACHVDYAKEAREASPKEYIDLKTELKNLGYNLEIL